MTQRDEAAFDGFVRDRGPGLLRTASLLLGDRLRAERALTAALSRAWRGWGSGDRSAAPEEAAEDVVLGSLVATAARTGRGAVPSSSGGAPPDEAGSGDPLRVAARESLRRQLAALPPDLRAVVVLRHAEGLPVARVALLLRRDAASVERAERTALQRLATEDALVPYLVLEPTA